MDFCPEYKFLGYLSSRSQNEIRFARNSRKNLMGAKQSLINGLMLVD